MNKANTVTTSVEALESQIEALKLKRARLSEMDKQEAGLVKALNAIRDERAKLFGGNGDMPITRQKGAARLKHGLITKLNEEAIKTALAAGKTFITVDEAVTFAQASGQIKNVAAKRLFKKIHDSLYTNQNRFSRVGHAAFTLKGA